MQLKTLKNSTGVAQSVVFGGRQFVLKGFAEETFDADVANAFLEKCSPAVVDTTEQLGRTYAPELEQDTLWIANMTGNPDLPDEVEVNRFDTTVRKWKFFKVANPLKAPRDLKRELKGNHEQYTGRDGGLVQRNLPSKILTVPMYRRRPLPRHEAEWFLARDSKSEVQGACLLSRAPTDFEPDMKWKLDDMRIYMQLIDPNLDRGPDAAAFVTEAKREAEKQADAMQFDGKDDAAKAKAKADYTDTQAKQLAAEKLRVAKQLLMRRLIFYIFNPAYALPTEREFNEFVTGSVADEVSREEIAELLANTEREVKKAKAATKKRDNAEQ